MRDLVQEGLAAQQETKHIDFKREFNPDDPGAWCEIVKDIAAMANSGGGVLLIGLDNGGKPCGFDPQPVLDIDPAKLTDKIARYTEVQFDTFSISEEKKEGHRLAVIRVDSADFPLVFAKAGTFSAGEKQKTAFSAGSVYFRHGAKSEPGNTSDLRDVIDRRLDDMRQSLLKGLRKVVEAPPGSQVYTFPPGVEVRESVSPIPRPSRSGTIPTAPSTGRLITIRPIRSGKRELSPR